MNHKEALADAIEFLEAQLEIVPLSRPEVETWQIKILDLKDALEAV